MGGACTASIVAPRGSHEPYPRGGKHVPGTDLVSTHPLVASQSSGRAIAARPPCRRTAGASCGREIVGIDERTSAGDGVNKRCSQILGFSDAAHT